MTRADVRRALTARRLVAVPGTEDHAGRIAYLVEYPSIEAIAVDVGIPSMGCVPAWLILEGNHRLAAAIFAGKTMILAEVQGELAEAWRLFSVDCSD